MTQKIMKFIKSGKHLRISACSLLLSMTLKNMPNYIKS